MATPWKHNLRSSHSTEIATETTPGFAILDAQWSPHSSMHGEVLAVATSTGRLMLYELQSNDGSMKLASRCSEQVCEASTLVLSLAWHPSQANVVGVTLSDGRVCLCECTGSEQWAPGTAISVSAVHEHSLEAWTLAFASYDSDTAVLSGGDDLVLQLSTLDDHDAVTHRWQDRKAHEAGVTAIVPLSSDLVLTGSYDDHLRLLSAPLAGRRQVLADVNLDGGVWRLKTLGGSCAPASPALSEGTRSLIILASCMHAGTRVVKLSRGRDDVWQFEVLAQFEEHKSMNYGSDFQPSESTLKSIVSTSFYDRLLCLWKFETRGNKGASSAIEPGAESKD
ncbi:hypothetical protein LTR56_018998 [Elasticomyces elasticus]|nr:hypothetical protein LTR56_018998 [Elasticomyces elasticus]KAK3635417.1 hypothetical protein LTR22_019225 [Elasticomyces elasticus]KAK4911808.1 hypothetical protein LTR49_019705 [Elasticomyces elasticus]KAK5751251.1 hypothetical protein LTS12_018644 [Elasticomyces elasticus]